MTADVDGKVDGAFTIPATVPEGPHTIELTGKDPQDVDRTVDLDLTVTTATTVTTLPVSGVGGTTGTTGTTGATTTGLAFTGSSTRTMVSAALLVIALGLFMLGRSARRRTTEVS
jgi:hypothetical protein